jgi:predicted nucleotidyltransferase
MVRRLSGGSIMIDEATINKAVDLLRQAAPGSTIIVFGSCARGQITQDSDLDVLVLEPIVTSRHEEMVRLREVLRPLGIPADVLVASKDTFEYWSDTPGTVFYEAAQEGRVFHATLP